MRRDKGQLTTIGDRSRGQTDNGEEATGGRIAALRTSPRRHGDGSLHQGLQGRGQPVEIAAALQRELDNNAQIVTRERSLVPNDFVIEFGSHDHERLAPYESTLTAELLELVREHADLQHYAFTGPVSVAFEKHDDLGTGQFRVRSTVRAGVDRGSTNRRTDATERGAAAYLTSTGLSIRSCRLGSSLGAEVSVTCASMTPGYPAGTPKSGSTARDPMRRSWSSTSALPTARWSTASERRRHRCRTARESCLVPRSSTCTVARRGGDWVSS